MISFYFPALSFDHANDRNCFPQDLILDQTIEKVSFCAPDRNFERAFSYICRDGTTRRWICHCFMAIKDSVRTSSVTADSMLMALYRKTCSNFSEDEFELSPSVFLTFCDAAVRIFILCVVRESGSATLWAVRLPLVWSENRSGRRSAASRQPLMLTEPLLLGKAHFVLPQQRRLQRGKKS